MTDQPEMSPLTEPEREWVRVRRDFAAQEGVDHLDLDAVAAYYDAVLARSQAEADELDPEELAVLLDVVAVLLGEHLGARHGMQWVTVADEEGPALALRDTLSDAVVFPQPVVGQSWNEQATGEWMGGGEEEGAVRGELCAGLALAGAGQACLLYTSPSPRDS